MPSASVGTGTALFEPFMVLSAGCRKRYRNPLGSILSTAMMLDFLKMHEEAMLIRDAVTWTLQNKFVTKDIDSINFYFTSTIGDLVWQIVSVIKSPGT